MYCQEIVSVRSANETRTKILNAYCDFSLTLQRLVEQSVNLEKSIITSVFTATKRMEEHL